MFTVLTFPKTHVITDSFQVIYERLLAQFLLLKLSATLEFNPSLFDLENNKQETQSCFVAAAAYSC